MKTKHFLICISAIILTACGSKSTEAWKLISNGEVILVEEPFMANQTDSIKAETDFDSVKVAKGNHLNNFVNEQLPESYTNRTFLKGLVTSTYDISLVPGYILKYNPSKNEYQKKTLSPVIKGKKGPVFDIIGSDDGLVYSNKINNMASFNATALIGGVEAKKNQMVELMIVDISKSVVPDSLIDKSAMKEIIKQIPKEELKNYYYVKNATLTLINYRVYNEAKFDAKVNATYVTAGGQVFSSSEKFSRNRIVTVELVPLEDLILH